MGLANHIPCPKFVRLLGRKSLDLSCSNDRKFFYTVLRHPHARTPPCFKSAPERAFSVENILALLPRVRCGRSYYAGFMSITLFDSHAQREKIVTVLLKTWFLSQIPLKSVVRHFPLPYRYEIITDEDLALTRGLSKGVLVWNFLDSSDPSCSEIENGYGVKQ